jgi:hypothetical protein
MRCLLDSLRLFPFVLNIAQLNYYTANIDRPL